MPDPFNQLVTVYYLRILSPEGKFVKEIDCGLREADAVRIMQSYLGDGNIAIIKKEKTSYDDYIPF